MQPPMFTLFRMLLLAVKPLYLRRSLLVQVLSRFVFLRVTSTLLCFLVSFCLVLPADASTGTDFCLLVANWLPELVLLCFGPA